MRWKAGNLLLLFVEGGGDGGEWRASSSPAGESVKPRAGRGEQTERRQGLSDCSASAQSLNSKRGAAGAGVDRRPSPRCHGVEADDDEEMLLGEALVGRTV